VGYERDTETGLDFAQARYYANAQGRFTSPDLPFADQYEGNPQSWNLYAYVRNNPLNATDPSGRETCYYNGNTVLACEGAKNYRIDYEHNLIYIKDKKGRETSHTLDARFIVRGYQDPAQVLVQELGRYTPALAKFTTNGAIVAGTVITAGTLGLVGGGTVTLGLSGAGASGGVITGLYGTTTVATLESLAASGGPTVQVVTNLTRAPVAGRALSTAVGNGAEALANAAGTIRGAGQLFRAQIPRALLEELKRVGLAREITTRMGSVTGTEVRFAPQITRFIVNFFK
ncbi:MAG: RHS repeat-associated core domain-containing protein, partial [Blastocatellales bacterium]|nr:RHS repeat-associated core domain-containing protein [Blastocatellales bacterium]